MATHNAENLTLCSFCSKSNREVEGVIIGPPGIAICTECIDICLEVCNDSGWHLPTLGASSDVDYEKLGLRPRFNKSKFSLRENHCFYLGPFSEPFNTIYKDHICKAINSEGFTVERADEIFGTQPIIEDIWESIGSASIIVADVTDRNPNVMYEIGMAHTIGKPVVIVTQDINDVPFDLKHYRCIIYEYTPRGCENLEGRLASTIRFLKSRSPKPSA